jgi:hypothetical protein
MPEHGYDQLVAYRLAAIQERDSWAVGSSTAYHSEILLKVTAIEILKNMPFRL